METEQHQPLGLASQMKPLDWLGLVVVQILGGTWPSDFTWAKTQSLPPAVTPGPAHSAQVQGHAHPQVWFHHSGPPPLP